MHQWRLLMVLYYCHGVPLMFNLDFRVELCHFADELMFEVRDKDHAYAEYIGAVVIPTHTLMQGAVKEGWFPILKKNKMSQRGTLNLRVQFISQVGCFLSLDIYC